MEKLDKNKGDLEPCFICGALRHQQLEYYYIRKGLKVFCSKECKGADLINPNMEIIKKLEKQIEVVKVRIWVINRNYSDASDWELTPQLLKQVRLKRKLENELTKGYVTTGIIGINGEVLT